MAQPIPFSDEESSLPNHNENLFESGGKVIGEEEMLGRVFAQNPRYGLNCFFGNTRPISATRHEHTLTQ